VGGGVHVFPSSYGGAALACPPSVCVCIEFSHEGLDGRSYSVIEYNTENCDITASFAAAAMGVGRGGDEAT